MVGCDESGCRGVTPLSVPAGAERVVLFGGSFDPPTLAHAAVGARARDLGAGPGAWLVLVPAARSPFKASAPTEDHHRIAMMGLAAGGIERAVVWTDEIDRTAGETPSYWVETLRRARAQLPDARLWFVLGADQAAAFHRWREPHEILELAAPIVVLRDPIGTAERLLEELVGAGFWSDVELAEWCGSVVEMEMVAGSATEVRRALAESGVGGAEIVGLLDPRVLGYVREHRLYGVNG